MKTELRNLFGNSVTTAELGKFNKAYLQRAWAGELKRLSRGVWSLEEDSLIIEPQEGDMAAWAGAHAIETRAELIRKRFRIMGTLADGVVDRNIRALMVAGAAGVGKTYELEHKLTSGRTDSQIESYEAVKGSISAVGLYQKLWDNHEEGQVLLLDDCDAVFNDEEALNLLKAALDTSTTRIISWAKASRFLQDNDIPNSFEYKGQIVFITNLDPEKIIRKGGRLAPHMSALLSRTVFLDLCIHDAESIMVRIEQVLDETTLKDDLGISNSESDEIVDWLKRNVKQLRSISIRTVIQIAGFVKTTENWKEIAEVTLLRANPLTMS